MNADQIIAQSLRDQLPAETVTGVRSLLSGAVGSVLSGLDKDTSDVDRMSIYAYSNEATVKAMIGGSNIKEAFFNADPDVFGYEAVRIAELLLKSNAPVLNFMHAQNYEASTEIGLELASIAQERFMTLDALMRVFPASANASYRESLANASRADMPADTLIKDAPKNVARKLKVAFVILEQISQALENGFYQTRVEDRNWFLNVYPEMDYASADALFLKRLEKVKSVDPKAVNYRAMYDNDDVQVLRDWVFRAKDFRN